jgi:hypothetical protein
LSDRTPHLRGIHLSAISGDAEKAGLLLGLEESPLEDITLSDIALSAKKGLIVRNARNVELDTVRIDAADGPAITAEHTEDLELSGVRTQAPHRGTPVILLSNVARSLVRGSFAAPGSDIFLEVKGPASAAIVVEAGHFFGVEKPIVVAADTIEGAVRTIAVTSRHAP